jgi:hypothetical protein
MLKSYKNKEYISQLNSKELTDYYNCYSHHGAARLNCDQIKSSNDEKDKQIDNEQCPFMNDADHFCTGHKETACMCTHNSKKSDTAPCLISHDHSLIVCENYAPSYTSKTDQIKTLKREVNQMKKSKYLLKKAMEDLDKLIQDNEPEKQKEEYEDEVEKFYRSSKFIGSSISVKSLNKDLPRQDIRQSKYIFNLNLNYHKLYPEYGASVFNFYDRNTFADKEILDKEAAIRPKKPTRPASKASQGIDILDLRAKSAKMYTKTK